LAGFTLLALPAAPNPLRDLDMGPGVEVVLAAGRAVQQIAENVSSSRLSISEVNTKIMANSECQNDRKS